MILGGEWLKSDPGAAARCAAENMEPGWWRSNGLRQAAQHWAAAEPEAAVNWAQSLAGEERSVTLRSVLESWAKAAPVAAATYLATQADPQSASDLVEPLLTSWALSDPRSAAVWVEGFPDGELRSRATEEIARSWMKAQPADTESWLATLNSDADRDAALAGCLQVLAFNNELGRATSMGMRISDSEKRASQLAVVVPGWLQLEPEQANRWLVENHELLGESLVRRIRAKARE
jgi:hypothetical protein